MIRWVRKGLRAGVELCMSRRYVKAIQGRWGRPKRADSSGALSAVRPANGTCADRPMQPSMLGLWETGETEKGPRCAEC